jgi:D-alanine-D-alanine ligase
VPVMGDGAQAQALPIIQIKAPGGNYDFEHKYESNDTLYDCPAKLDSALAARIQELAVRAYRSVGCTGWGRVDFMLRATDNEPFLLEVNTSPGMTSHSLVPMAAKAVGISYAALCLQILQSASLKIADVQP